MRSITYNLILILLLICVFSACRNDTPKGKNYNSKDLKEPLIEANKHVVKTENQHIEDLLRRYQWDMIETGSGLRYMVYHEGQGEKAVKGKMATIDYEVRFITGDLVYSSSKDGQLSFVIGKGEVISGLEEGILFLNVGDKAKFIIPSHLAYGLVGDDDRIPGKASLIYDITLLNLNDQIN